MKQKNDNIDGDLIKINTNGNIIFPESKTLSEYNSLRDLLFEPLKCPKQTPYMRFKRVVRDIKRKVGLICKVLFDEDSIHEHCE